MHFVHRLVPGVLAGSLLLGGVSGAFAASPHKAVKFGYAYGQVANLSTSSFTLTRTNAKTGATKSVQVSLSGTTKEKARKGTTGALANGEWALAVGPKSTAGIAANRVLYSSKKFKASVIILRLKLQRAIALARRHRVAGTVSPNQTAGTLTITTKKGKSISFQLAATTKYAVSGQAATTAPTFTAGEKVVVWFKRDRATKTWVALRVNVPAQQ